MSKKQLNSLEELSGLVFSTNPNYQSKQNETKNESIPYEEQKLDICLEKKGRGGKTVVLIKGFKGNEDELNKLSKILKQHCGVGGTVKDGEIVIQGNVRDKIWDKLLQLGFKKLKRVGG